MAWARDPTRSASFGIDPFRLRSGIWMQLAPAERKQLYVALRKEIETTIPVLEQYLGETDQVEAVRAELGLATQRARLEILTRWTRGMPSTQRKKNETNRYFAIPQASFSGGCQISPRPHPRSRKGESRRTRSERPLRDMTETSPKVGNRPPSTLRIARCEPEAKDLRLAGAQAALPRHRFRECGRKWRPRAS